MKFVSKFLALALVANLSAPAWSCSVDGKDGFLPDNTLYISADTKGLKGGLTEEQFNNIIDKVETVMAPIVSSKGGVLSVERAWKDGTVNAYANRSGNQWVVHMFGGLARHATVTEDGFALVMCHEIGHHIGGAPQKGGLAVTSGGWWGGSLPSGTRWASNEGQADYYATLKCLRRVYLNDDNTTLVAQMTVPKTLSKFCHSTFKNDKTDANICIRAAMSGLSIANLFAALRAGTAAPDFDKPDTNVVSTTYDNHPASQCRLDTYFQGAICDVDFNTDVSNSDANVGTCSIANGNKIGNRPLCWFKPSTDAR